jgi:hypothetical protein
MLPFLASSQSAIGIWRFVASILVFRGLSFYTHLICSVRRSPSPSSLMWEVESTRERRLHYVVKITKVIRNNVMCTVYVFAWQRQTGASFTPAAAAIFAAAEDPRKNTQALEEEFGRISDLLENLQASRY